MALKHTFLGLALALTATASPQAPEDLATYTINDPVQLSRISSRFSTFDASLTKDPKFSSIMSVGETAFPSNLNWDQVNAPGKTMTTESWYRALPSDIKSWWASVASEERRLITDTAEGPAPPTPAPKGASASASSGGSSDTAGGSKTSSASASKTQKAANGTAKANAADEHLGGGRLSQAVAVGVAGAIGAVALLL